jgi:glycosyltransferase involved in cell wall biosynthesis
LIDKVRKIGIIEIYGHHVFVNTLGALALESGQDVTIFVTQPIYEELIPLFGDRLTEITWVIKGERESDWRYLQRVQDIVRNNIDLLFINTVQGKRIILFYLFKPLKKTIVAAGRISEWFGNRYRLLSFSSIRRLLHHNYTHFLMQRCIPRYDGIIVHTPQARDLALTNGYSKEIILLPYSLYKGETKINKPGEKTKFLATGSINETSRDHMGLLKAFERVWARGRKDASLTVLGMPQSKHGQTVLAYMESLKSRGFDIHFFKEFIPEEVYLKQAESADIYIAPLNIGYYSCGELTSGMVEAIRQGKPCIYPQGHFPDPRFESSSLFYDKIEDLPELITEILDDREILRRLSLNAIANAEPHSLKKTATYFREQLNYF